MVVYSSFELSNSGSNQHILIANKFLNGEYEIDVREEFWQEAFKYIALNAHQLTFNKSKIHTLWTVNGGHLRRKIKNDELILSVLTHSLPKYMGNEMTLYRGECKFLYDENKIGFCWSPCIEVASMFARGLNSIESGGVLLKARAPVAAIMAAPNEHSSIQMQEFEYTCNPNLLEEIEVLRIFEKFHN